MIRNGVLCQHILEREDFQGFRESPVFVAQTILRAAENDRLPESRRAGAETTIAQRSDSKAASSSFHEKEDQMTNNTNAPRKIGYARVSKADQHLDLQIIALKDAGCDRIYADHGVSGTKRHRPEFDKALKALRPDDILVVWKLDRMSRSLRDLVDLMEELRTRQCHFECLSDKIDTTSAMGQFTFHIMAALAELERSLISERTKAGLEAARQRGVKLGRPQKSRFKARHLIAPHKHRATLAHRFYKEAA